MVNHLNDAYYYPAPDDERRKKVKPADRDHLGRPVDPYLPTRELAQAVNVAIVLKRPLLIKGEPGSGKTRLARDVAFQLDLLQDHYFEWFVKSTDNARAGLYTYDAVGRLHDTQLDAVGKLDEKIKEQIESNPEYYVHYGPLGQAFKLLDRRSVVLIDEIDKADIDFPNDLLLELDERRFFIEELQRKPVIAQQPPIVIVTSNDEKDLPDAFLRRCLFHYIEFPKPEALRDIVKAHFEKQANEQFLGVMDELIEVFMELRKKMDKGQTGKKVSTSELIDWTRLLIHYQDYVDLDRFYEKLLYPGVLLKSWEDYQQYTNQMKQVLAERKQKKMAPAAASAEEQ
jgi:MoxR-like ATPase